jgi:uncharacterized protein (DUF58 family)
MRLLNDIHLPSFSGTKEIRGIRSRSLRWVWHVYTARLTSAGRWFLWPTVGFLAYTSASLDFQSFVPLSYVTGLWLIAMLTAFFVRPRATLRAAHAERICAGETLIVDAEVLHQGGAGADLYVVPHRLPREVDAVPPDGAPLPPLAVGQKANVKLGLRCTRRGVYALQGYRIETDFPFGVITAARVVEAPKPLLVYPSFRPLTSFKLPEGRRYQPGGVALASETGDSAEYAGNREYREGDNVRDIDWRATARLGMPIIREYRQEYFLRVAVVVDTHIPSQTAGGMQQRRQSFEHAVSIAAAVGDYLARKEYIVDLFAAGPNLFHLTAGRSLAYLDQILDILACIGESPSEPFESIAPELMANMGSISSIICVFLDWNESRRQFVNMLRAQGVGVKAIVISNAPCAMDPLADGEILLSHADVLAGVEDL